MIRRPIPIRSLAVALAAGLVLALGIDAGPAIAVDAEYQAKMRLANRYLAQGVPDAAIKVLQQVLEKHPADLRASMTYANALIQTDLLDEAERFLTEALQAVQEKPDLYRTRVRLRRAQGRLDEAFADVLLILDARLDLAAWAYRETHELLDEGLDADRAWEAARGLGREHEMDVEIVILAGVVAVHREGGEEALDLVTDFDRTNDRQGRAVQAFAESMLGLGEEGLALEGLLAAVERTSRPEKRSPLLFQVAEIQERQGKYEDALASLARITREREGTTASGNALLRRAQIHQAHLNDPQGALAVYERIHDDPILGHHRPAMLLQMADCYVRLGAFESATRKYSMVIPEAFDPEEAELAALKLADVQLFSGNPDSALVLYQDMAERNPRSLFADQAADRYILLNRHQGLGRDALVRFGRLEWARLIEDSLTVQDEAREILARRPPPEIAVEAMLALSEAAERGGNFERALDHLESLVRRYPSERRTPEALMRQGRILRETLDRPQEALVRYETVLTDYPASVQAGDARRLVETLRRELKS
jgi:tetratricopeptide (TPR) repeat protein